MTREDILKIEHKCIIEADIYSYLDDEPKNYASLLFYIDGINSMADALINELNRMEKKDAYSD